MMASEERHCLNLSTQRDGDSSLEATEITQSLGRRVDHWFETQYVHKISEVYWCIAIASRDFLGHAVEILLPTTD